MRRFVLIALLGVGCAPRFPTQPPTIQDRAPQLPPAIRLFSFYPAIPAHDPTTGERTGRYVPAHGLIERTGPLRPVVAHVSWQGRSFAAPVVFHNGPWG